MMGMVHQLTGRLLQLANGNPGAIDRGEFFRFKTRLLDQYGHHEETVVQHIKKTCWACDGTGTFRGFDNGLTWVPRPPQPCLRCNKGVFQEFWVILKSYRLGENAFFVPGERTWLKSRVPEGMRVIEGYVDTKHVNYKVAARAFLVLALVFDLGLFLRLLASTPWISRKRYRLRNLVWEIKSWWEYHRPRLSRQSQENLDMDFSEIPF